MKRFFKKTDQDNSTEKDGGEDLWKAIIDNEQGLPDEIIKNNHGEGRQSLWRNIEVFGKNSGMKVPNQILTTNYETKYDEKTLFDKIGEFALVAGKKVIFQVLVLYYCLRDRDTPAWAKSTIIGALGYFIFPLDAIPDIITGIGYSDDFGVLVFAMGTVLAHIKKEHKSRAREQMARIFGKC